jgi:Ca-activated chloride channel family protein
LIRYVYPLNTEKFSAKTLDDVSVRIEIRDQQPIRAVYSPSHPITVDRQDDRHVIAQYSAKDVRPDSDLTLFYSVGETQAFHLFTFRDSSDLTDPDGFFLMLLAPQPGDNHDQVAKDVLLVLDRSGSMEGEKFQQAQAALRFILGKLNPQDRFYLQTFSNRIETYADGLCPASEAEAAIDWVNRLNAEGSTDINWALLEASAVVDRSRPTYLIFLTDGLPTEGEIHIQNILDNVAEAAP